MSGPPTSADERSCVDVEARHGFAGARPRVGGCGGPCRGPPRRTMSERLRVRQGGDGGPVLLLLQGLGATGDVWRGLLDLLNDRWPGRWVAPDLPGHGGSEALASYSFGRLAAAVAPAVPPADRVVALGHSLGGVVALTLASGRFGVRVSAVCGLGIKVAWTEEELARARALSTRPHPKYATRREAAERHLKLAGLTGLVAPDAVADAAIAEGEGGWTGTSVTSALASGALGRPDSISTITLPWYL